MTFIKRTTAPTKKTKWFCDNNPFYNSNYSMFNIHPKLMGNCTHYAYSRASEILNKKSDLPTCNAENWFYKTKYKVGSIPKLGSIICYKNKSGGHVAIVEELTYDYLILSMSGWNSYLFKTKKVYRDENYEYGSNELIGFIYLPNLNYYDGVYPTLPKIGYLKNGDKGENVKKLQKLLNWLNDSNLKIDGIIGIKTVTEIKTFQKNNNLSVDGLFGKKSLNKSMQIKK